MTDYTICPKCNGIKQVYDIYTGDCENMCTCNENQIKILEQRLKEAEEVIGFIRKKACEGCDYPFKKDRCSIHLDCQKANFRIKAQEYLNKYKGDK